MTKSDLKDKVVSLKIRSCKIVFSFTKCRSELNNINIITNL